MAGEDVKETVFWVTPDATRGQVTLLPVIKETKSVHFSVIMFPRRQTLPDITTVSQQKNENTFL